MQQTPYMSQEKYKELQEERRYRTHEGRRAIAEQLAHAKQLGDLSENFEYHDAKDKQSENEQRIQELEAILLAAVIVDDASGGTTIGIGTSFTARREGAKVAQTFRVVGSNEANPLEGQISNESPLGRAFLGAHAGQTVEVQTPSGSQSYTVEAIK
jgi:transcription elongation factor GreA